MTSAEVDPPVLHHLDCPAQCLLRPQLQALVVGIRPDQDNGWKQQMKSVQEEHATDFVVEISRMDFHLE